MNLKIGKTKDFLERENQYQKTFGKDNVVFSPMVTLKDFSKAEKLVLKSLEGFRVVSFYHIK